MEQRFGKHYLFRDRCLCLIFAHQGYTIYQLAELFKVHHTTIYSWFKLWDRAVPELCIKEGVKVPVRNFRSIIHTMSNLPSLWLKKKDKT